MYSRKTNLFSLYNLKFYPGGGQSNTATAMIKTRLTKLFNMSDYRKILDKDTNIIKMLNEKNYAIDESASLELSLLSQIENSFVNEIKKFANSISSLYSEELKKNINHFIFVPNDLFNLKIIYKNLYEETAFDSFSLDYFGVLNKNFFQKLYNGKPLYYPYFVKQYINNFTQKNIENVYDIDLAWDKYLHHFQNKTVKLLNSDILQRLLILQIDIKNILIFFRNKGAENNLKLLKISFIPGGNISYHTLASIFKKNINELPQALSYLPFSTAIEQGIESYKQNNNFSELNKLLGQYEQNILKRLGSMAQGFELLVIYYWLRKKEVENLRILLSSKLNNMNPEWVLNKIKVSL